MANQTLLPFSQKTETRKDPSRAPGAMGWINEIIGETTELVVEGGGSFVNEKPLTKQEFQDIQKQPEHRAGMPVRGSIEFNQRSGVVNQEIGQISAARSTVDALKARREEVNKKIGIGNISYEDPVRKDFNLRVDVQADLDRANSALSEEKLQAKREFQIQQAQGRKASALNAAMEGAAGQTGSGQANISFQAVG